MSCSRNLWCREWEEGQNVGQGRKLYPNDGTKAPIFITRREKLMDMTGSLKVDIVANMRKELKHRIRAAEVQDLEQYE